MKSILSFPIANAFLPFRTEEELHVIYTEAFDIFKFGGERIHSPKNLEVVIRERSYFLGFCYDTSRITCGTASAIRGDERFWDEAETLQEKVDSQYPWASTVLQESFDRIGTDVKTGFAMVQRR